MDVGYGLVSCQLHADDPRSWTMLYREAVELAELAERLGFSSLWTTEHHFVDDGYMPSLLPVAAAMAARTNEITLATGVLLAPLHHPLRLAEDAATVALLSEGRLRLGMGLGWSEIEFEAFGADLRKRGAAMTEILQILGAAWRGEVIEHMGPVYEIPRVIVRPIPEDPVPMWIGGDADVAIRRAVALADGFFSNATPERFAEQVTVGREEVAVIGRGAPFAWGYYQYLYLADDAEQGWNQVRDHLWLSRWKYSDMGSSAGRPVGAVGAVARPPTPDNATIAGLREMALIGSAAEVAERIVATRQHAGVPFEFVARSYFPGMAYNQQREQMHRIADELMPLLAGVS